MSWHFSAALEAEFSAVTFSGGAQSVRSSGCPTLDPSSCNDKTTESCDHSRSGMMSRPSTGDHGLDAWMSSLEDSHARTSPQPERVPGSTALAPECGDKWLGSLARYDPDSRSWKTPQCSLLEGLDVFSGTWPRWGMMRNGVCWERMTVEPPISATESGFWPTPTRHDGKDNASPAAILRKSTGLGVVAQIWPTPRTRGLLGGSGSREMVRAMVEDGSIEEQEAVQMLGVKIFPTPCARDWKSGTGAQERPGHALPLSSAIGGQLNPTWVEWLIGWPLGWTDSKPLETDKCPSAQPSHGAFCPKDWLDMNRKTLVTLLMRFPI